MPDEKNLPFRECLACDMQEHRFAETLDHPDGSVTYEKLSDEVKTKLAGKAESENFEAIYGQTKWTDVYGAFVAKKHVYATAGSNVYVLISVDANKMYFSRSQQKSIDYVMIDSSDKWSSSSVKILEANNIKFADGENLEAKMDALEARIAALEA